MTDAAGAGGAADMGGGIAAAAAGAGGGAAAEGRVEAGRMAGEGGRLGSAADSWAPPFVPGGLSQPGVPHSLGDTAYHTGAGGGDGDGDEHGAGPWGGDVQVRVRSSPPGGGEDGERTGSGARISSGGLSSRFLSWAGGGSGAVAPEHLSSGGGGGGGGGGDSGGGVHGLERQTTGEMNGLGGGGPGREDTANMVGRCRLNLSNPRRKRPELSA